jgi:hypothetical protein
MPDGKPENTFAFDGEFQGPEFAKKVSAISKSRVRFPGYLYGTKCPNVILLEGRKREFFVHLYKKQFADFHKSRPKK